MLDVNKYGKVKSVYYSHLQVSFVVEVLAAVTTTVHIFHLGVTYSVYINIPRKKFNVSHSHNF